MRSWQQAPWQVQLAVVLIVLWLGAAAAGVLLLLEDRSFVDRAVASLGTTMDRSRAELVRLVEGFVRGVMSAFSLWLLLLALRTVQRRRISWGLLLLVFGTNLLQVPRSRADATAWALSAGIAVLLLLPAARHWALRGPRWRERHPPPGPVWPVTPGGLQRPD